MADAIPDDIDVLMVVHPQNPRVTLHALEQYLFAGGKMVLFLDPVAEGRLYTKTGVYRKDISPLLKVLGIDYGSKKVVAEYDVSSTRYSLA